MSKPNRKDLAERIAISSGATIQGQDRFAQASAILRAQPTGFSAPESASVASNATERVHPSTGEMFEEVELHLIDPNPFNARKFYSDDSVATLAISLAADGQEVPGTATVRAGRYVLAAGHYRLRALKLAGLQRMKLMVKQGLTDRDLFRISFLENDQRSSQSALDNAFVWHDMLERKLYASESDLAEATKKSLPTINKTLSVLKLGQEILDLVATDPSQFGMSVLYELLQLQDCAGKDVCLKLAESIRRGEASRRTIQEMREQLAAPSERKKKQNSRQNFKLMDLTGKSIGTIKEWDDGRIALEIVVPDPSARERIFGDLKKQFGID